MSPRSDLRVLALAGGVGGAKLASGLAQLLGDRLTVLVNTGDDFDHLGLHISPDLDTVMYTLAGIANPEVGWGIDGESWNFMDQIQRLGGPTWFQLGDRDLATHAVRTARLNRGERLTDITIDFCRAWGIRSKVLPMTDDSVRTIVHSGDEIYSFQDYFVRLKCNVPVTGLSFDGANVAKYNERLAEFARAPSPHVIIICPSNPYLSINPILALPGLRDWMKQVSVATIAVSPIVGGAAIKGPAAKIMKELSLEPSATTVAQHYKGIIDGFIFDSVDADSLEISSDEDLKIMTTQTVMRSLDDRVALGRACLAFAEALSAREA